MLFRIVCRTCKILKQNFIEFFIEQLHKLLGHLILKTGLWIKQDGNNFCFPVAETEIRDSQIIYPKVQTTWEEVLKIKALLILDFSIYRTLSPLLIYTISTIMYSSTTWFLVFHQEPNPSAKFRVANIPTAYSLLPSIQTKPNSKECKVNEGFLLFLIAFRMFNSSIPILNTCFMANKLFLLPNLSFHKLKV